MNISSMSVLLIAPKCMSSSVPFLGNCIYISAFGVSCLLYSLFSSSIMGDLLSPPSIGVSLVDVIISSRSAWLSELLGEWVCCY